MFESINWLAILVASISSFVLGGLWYSPVLFLNAWLADMNVETDKAGHPAKVFGLAFVFSTIGCIVMSGFLVVGEGILAGALLGLKVGLGFVFCSFGINYQFANRPIRALLIDGGYHTLQFLIYGLILGAWPW